MNMKKGSANPLLLLVVVVSVVLNVWLFQQLGWRMPPIVDEPTPSAEFDERNLIDDFDKFMRFDAYYEVAVIEEAKTSKFRNARENFTKLKYYVDFVNENFLKTK